MWVDWRLLRNIISQTSGDPKPVRVPQWLPESPRFDMLSGRTAKALETLRYIAKQNGKPMPEAKIMTFKEVRCCSTSALG